MLTPGNKTALEELAKEKKALEGRLYALLVTELAAFKDATGINPSGVQVSMTRVETIGDRWPSYIVTHVNVNLDVGDL